MITWTNLSGLYPTEQQVLINAFIAAYTNQEDFAAVDFGMFSAKPESKLFTEINNLIIDEFADFGENTFLYQLTYFLHQKAIQTDNYVTFLDAFEEIDRPYAKELVSNLEANEIPFSYLQSGTPENLLAIAERLRNLTFPFTFWEEFARSMKFRIEKLKETASEENEQEALAEYFPYDDRAVVQALLEALYASDSYLTIYSLSKSQTGLLAQKIEAIPTENTAFPLLAEMLVNRLHRLYAANYSNEYFLPALLQLYPTELRTGIESLVQQLMLQENAETIRILAEKLTIDNATNKLASLSADHAFIHGLAAWLVEAAILYAQKTGLTSVPFQPSRKEVTGKLNSYHTDRLENYLVKVYEIGTENLLDQAFTQALGRFYFSFIPAFETTETGTITYQPKELRFDIFEVSDADNSLASVVTIIEPEQTYVEIETVITETELPLAQGLSVVPFLAVPVENQEAITGFLAAITMEDIRNAGSVANLEGAEVFGDDLSEVIQKIDAHANLNAFSADEGLNDLLITGGFDSIDKIITADSGDLESTLVTGYIQQNGEINLEKETELRVQANNFYRQAGNYDALSQALNILARSSEVSGLDGGEENEGGENLRVSLTGGNSAQKCSCKGCQTAVSPSAYLNALLKYTTDFVKNSNAIVTIGNLEELFLQPFTELASYCQEATERNICQVRVAIETLRRYIKNQSSIPTAEKDLEPVQKLPYLSKVYETLLLSIGTSTAELKKQVQENNIAKLTSFAKRLQLPVSFITTNLYLSESGSGRNELTEKNIELLFGLQDTSREQFDTGVKLGDGTDPATLFLKRWDFRGAQWKKNTDAYGYVYIRFVSNKVNIYKSATDSTNEFLVGQGEVLNPVTPNLNKTQKITPYNGSELYGELEYQDTTLINLPDLKISLIPEVTAQRFAYQEAAWVAEQLPEAQPAIQAFTGSFIIDPDVIGPDDIRNPLVNNSFGNRVFNIWKWRAAFLDELFTTTLSSASLPDMIETLKNQLVYYGTTIQRLNIQSLSNTFSLDPSALHPVTNILKHLYREYKSGTATSLVKATIETGSPQLSFGLTIESFVRLNELIIKSEANTISPAELAEAVSILTQTSKSFLKGVWMMDEEDIRVEIAQDLTINPDTFSLLDPMIFQAPINQPTEGIWDLRSKTGIPYIDPEIITLKDLPEPAFGKDIIQVWLSRHNVLRNQAKSILAAKATGTVKEQAEKMLMFIHPGFPDFPKGPGNVEIFEDLEALYDELESSQFQQDTQAGTYVFTTLGFTVEEFDKFFAIWRKTSTSEKEWEELAVLLASVWKRKTLYASWMTEEDTLMNTTLGAGYHYWNMYKQRLVKWRATDKQRSTWQQALLAVNFRPVVDPDQLADGDFLHPELDGVDAHFNAAYELYDYRKNVLESWQTDISITGYNFAQAIKEFVFGIPTSIAADPQDFLDELEDLNDLRVNNANISGRLNQLNLSAGALEYLVINQTEFTSSPTDEEVRNQLVNILIQCRKQRMYAIWRREEAAKEIVVSDLYFKQAFQQPDRLNAYIEGVFVPSRSNRRARKDWQNLLEARIEQRNNLAAQLKQAVEEAESLHLITLRDLLLEHKITIPNTAKATVTEKAAWLSDRLLIDLQINCCQTTTRLAQALEVLQKNVFLNT